MFFPIPFPACNWKRDHCFVRIWSLPLSAQGHYRNCQAYMLLTKRLVTSRLINYSHYNCLIALTRRRRWAAAITTSRINLHQPLHSGGHRTCYFTIKIYNWQCIPIASVIITCNAKCISIISTEVLFLNDYHPHSRIIKSFTFPGICPTTGRLGQWNCIILIVRFHYIKYPGGVASNNNAPRGGERKSLNTPFVWGATEFKLGEPLLIAISKWLIGNCNFVAQRVSGYRVAKSFNLVISIIILRFCRQFMDLQSKWL